MGFLYKFIVISLVIILGNHISEAQNLTECQRNKTSFQYLIKGGHRPKVHKLAKYIVSLYADKHHFCGGSIYNEVTIITAAHCFTNGTHPRNPQKDIRVLAGSINRYDHAPTAQVRRVRKVILHKGYKPPKLIMDICILILDKPLVLDGKNVAAVQLASSSYPKDTKCVAFGWGCLYVAGPQPLEVVYLDSHLLSPKECLDLYASTDFGMVCAQNKNDTFASACSGDSGGPLMCDEKLVGVASFTHRWCYSADVYTDVFYYTKWIKQQVAGSATQKSNKLILICFGMIMIFI